MIIGVGVDICSVSRMSKSLDIEGFRERVFCAEEIGYAQKKAKPAASFAAAFAAKEAFAKAGGWGLARVGLKGACVRRTDSAPVLTLDERAAALLKEKGAKNVFLSISHERDYAVALVVLEG